MLTLPLRRGRCCRRSRNNDRLGHTPDSACGGRHAARTRPRRFGMPERRPQERHVPSVLRRPSGGTLSAGGITYIGTVEAEPYAAGEHPYVALADAGIGAGGAALLA